MKIEIWSDVVCPWCYIGKRRFDEAVAQIRERHPEADFDIAYRAFQLDPGAPDGEGQPVLEFYAEKFGGPEQAQKMTGNVLEAANEVGLEMNFDVARRANTRHAHRLLVLAESLGLQRELKERLMRAYFANGESLGVIGTLIDAARDVGIDPETARAYLAGDGGEAEVSEQLDFAARAGISSVPTFVFNREAALPGAQPTEVFVQILEQMLAAEATEV